LDNELCAALSSEGYAAERERYLKAIPLEKFLIKLGWGDEPGKGNCRVQ
jgi:hypothetical protein